MGVTAEMVKKGEWLSNVGVLFVLYVIQGGEAEGLSGQVDPTVSVMTSYDPPWTKEDRRDEVMIRVLSQEQQMWVGPWGLF